MTRHVYAEKLKDVLLRTMKVPLRAVPLWVEAIGAGLFIAETLEKNPRFRKKLSEIDGKVFKFVASDIDRGFFLYVKNNDIKVYPHMWKDPDVTMKGTVAVLVELLLGRVDPDTVFFSRRLEIVGDTASAIYFKNLLAALE